MLALSSKTNLSSLRQKLVNKVQISFTAMKIEVQLNSQLGYYCPDKHAI